MAKKISKGSAGNGVTVGISIAQVLVWGMVCVAGIIGTVGLIAALARRSMIKKCGGNRVLAKHGSLIF
ncbi:MAG: hypothetical protein LBU70_01185 [Chitinispirillales bacterium]|nr:hypothetical protein [Chitinispirillales bacterium]